MVTSKIRVNFWSYLYLADVPLYVAEEKITFNTGISIWPNWVPLLGKIDSSNYDQDIGFVWFKI